MNQVVEKTLKLHEESNKETSVGSFIQHLSKENKKKKVQPKITSGQLQSDSPSLEFRMQTSRFLTELASFKQSAKVLETVIAEDDENIEAWYLMAFATFKLNKITSAEECCKSVRDLMLKLKIANPELEEATLEIYKEIQSIKKKGDWKVIEGGQEGDDDEDYESCSEESLSDVEGDNNPEDAEMKE